MYMCFIFRMLVETFGPYLHQGMVTNAHRLCGGCGCNRGRNWCVRRGQEPVHICTLPSADAFKHRRWELSMDLMRDEEAVGALMDQLIEKVCTICLSVMCTISYVYLLLLLQVLENPKVSKRGAIRWLMEGNEARWMVDDGFMDIQEWMKKAYPLPMFTEDYITCPSDDDADSIYSSAD